MPGTNARHDTCGMHVTLETFGRGLGDITVMAFRTFAGKNEPICMYLAFSLYRLKLRFSTVIRNKCNYALVT